MKLRPYQRRLVAAVLKDVAAGTPEIVLAAAPGSGKTEMAFAVIRNALAKRHASRVLVLAHGTTVLRRQFAERAVAELGENLVHEHLPRGKLPASAANVIIALPQSLHRRENLPACDLVIVDEAHEFYNAEMAKRVIRKVGAKSVVLLTGTPSKFIARGLPLHSIALHDVMRECPSAVCDPAIDLVASEFLIPFDRFSKDGEVRKDVRFGRAATMATLDGLLEKMVAHLPSRRRRSDLGWQATIAEMGKTIVACRSLALARKVATYFRKRGVNAGLSTHQDDAGSEEIQRFKDDATMALLIVVRRGVLGFNFPELINLVDMTGTINIDRIFQMFARVVRLHPTKPKIRKLFVKMTPKGKMEAYTKDVMSAALQLGRKETFESFNGGNLDGMVIPRWRGDEDGGEARKSRETGAPKKMRPLAKCFLASDFFEAVDSMDQEFSPYAKTTLGISRDSLLINKPRRTNECSFDGCDKDTISHGLCAGHYSQDRRGETLSPLRSILGKGKRKPCGFPACKRNAKARDLCSAHYLQSRKGLPLTPVDDVAKSLRRTSDGDVKKIHSLYRDGKSMSMVSKITGISLAVVCRYVILKFGKRKSHGSTCSFKGCGRKYATKGLCGGHYSQLRSGLKLRRLRLLVPGRKDRKCKFEGCGRRLQARDLCAAHYRQLTVNGELIPIRQSGRGTPCRFTECERGASVKGFCKPHRAQLRRTGKLKPLRIRGA